LSFLNDITIASLLAIKSSLKSYAKETAAAEQIRYCSAAAVSLQGGSFSVFSISRFSKPIDNQLKQNFQKWGHRVFSKQMWATSTTKLKTPAPTTIVHIQQYETFDRIQQLIDKFIYYNKILVFALLSVGYWLVICSRCIQGL